MKNTFILLIMILVLVSCGKKENPVTPAADPFTKSKLFPDLLVPLDINSWWKMDYYKLNSNNELAYNYTQTFSYVDEGQFTLFDYNEDYSTQTTYTLYDCKHFLLDGVPQNIYYGYIYYNGVQTSCMAMMQTIKGVDKLTLRSLITTQSWSPCTWQYKYTGDQNLTVNGQKFFCQVFGITSESNTRLDAWGYAYGYGYITKEIYHLQSGNWVLTDKYLLSDSYIP